jgi:hypothetical protein
MNLFYLCDDFDMERDNFRLLNELIYSKHLLEIPIVVVCTHYDLLCHLFQSELYRAMILKAARRGDLEKFVDVKNGPRAYAYSVANHLMHRALEVSKCN